MNFAFKTYLICALLWGAQLTPASAQPASELPELSSLLALFSAHALPSGGVRINWTLEQSSPLIVSFRIYRGYEDLGNFSVLSEIPVHTSGETLDYSVTDTTAQINVSYYYKVSALGQSKESVFPVVISATPHNTDAAAENVSELPVMILPGSKVSLYVRRGGHVKLDLLGESHKSLVDDSLKPGIYEFDAPSSNRPVTLHLRHESGYETDVSWPLP